MNGPFIKIRAQWLTKIEAAKKQKKEFTRDGEECMRFFRGPYDFMYGLKEGVPQSGDFVFVGEAGGTPKPAICMTINKVAEAVQIFGPTLYHRNPVRKVTPRECPMIPIEAFGDPNNPQLQQYYQQLAQQVTGGRAVDKARACLLQWYQDYTPTATDLKSESRQAIDEAIIKGMGVLWPGLWTPPASQMRIACSEYDSVDNLLIDCDMESRKYAKWACRQRTKPVWEFESEFGIPHGTIKASNESFSQREFVEADGGTGELARRQGRTNDLITYYEIYSKMGMGPLMSGTDWDNESREVDKYGQYVKLVVCKELEYPANCPKEIWGDKKAMHKAVQWDAPYWMDDYWPFAELVFHDVTKQVWPMNHFKPAMGELKFLNWAYSFLASRMHKSCRDVIVCAKSMGEEMRRVILSGEDMELVQMEKSHGAIKDVVEILRFPEVNGDMFKVIEMVTHLFEQRTGLTELMYGETAHAYRSAEEANVKQSQLHIRPDDMVNKAEDWMGQIARMEALTARWHLEPARDIAPIMGQVGAQWWQQFISTSDPTEILHSLEYRIEANSAKKPNREKEMQDADAAVQQLATPLFQVAMQHNEPKPFNALMTIWAESHQWDVSQFLIPPPPPPQPPPPDFPKINLAIKYETLEPPVQSAILQMAGVPMPPPDPNAPPGPAQQQAMMEHQKSQQEMTLKQHEAQMKAAQAQQELQHKAAHAQIEAAAKQHEHAQKAAQHQHDMAVKAQELQHKQRMAEQAHLHAEAAHNQALRHADEKHKNDLKLAEEKAKHPPQGTKA